MRVYDEREIAPGDGGDALQRGEEHLMAAEYWYCLEHKAVEGADGCKNADRLGPYPSEAEASRALDKVQERNEAWENDPDWNDDLED